MLLEQSSPLFTLNLQDTHKEQAALLLECPISNNSVAASERKQILIANEPGIWWHCSECKGWHIMLGKR